MKTIDIITVPTEEVAAVARWTRDRDQERPWLEHVVFRGGEYVATDGHRLVRVPCKTHNYDFGIARRHILAADAAQQELWRFEGRTSLRYLTLIPHDTLTASLVISDHGLREVALRVSVGDLSRYPDVALLDGLCTGGRPGAPDPFGVNPVFLQGMADVHTANCRANPVEIKTSERPVILMSWAKEGPLVFKNDNGVRFVIMPVRIG